MPGEFFTKDIIGSVFFGKWIVSIKTLMAVGNLVVRDVTSEGSDQCCLEEVRLMSFF